MVKAYSRYTDSGSVGLIHTDAAGQTIAWSSNGKSLYSAVGTRLVELNAKTGSQVQSVSCSRSTLDEGLYSSALSLRQPARASTISATEEYLGMGCTDGSVRILALPLSAEEKQVASYQGHRGSVNAIAFSEPAGFIVTGGRDTEVVVWDLVGESGVCRLTGHKGEVTSVSFLPGNPDFVVSGSKDGVVKIWSVKLQICVQTITEPKSEVWSIAFFKNRLIVGSSDKVLYVYALRENLFIDSDGLTVASFFGQLDRPEPADGRIVALSVSSGSTLLAQTDRRVIEMWRIVADEDEKNKRMKRRLKRKDGAGAAADEEVGESARASDEFVIASSVENASVALRYVANAKVKAMAVNPTQPQIALGLADNEIELFKLATDAIKETRAIKREGHRSSVISLAVSSDSKRLISVSAEAILVWNAISLVFQRLIYSPSGEVVDAFFMPGDADRVILVTVDGHCCVVDVNSGSVVGTPVCLWAAVEEDEIPAPKKRKSKGADLNQVKCVSLFVSVDDDSCRLLIGDKERRATVVVVDADGGFTVVSSHELPDEPVCLVMSPKTNKYIAAGLLNSNIELIYSDSGKHYMSLYAHKLAVSAVAFSPDEQVVVSGSSDKSVKVWSVKFGNVLKSIRAHDSGVTKLCFVPHSHLVFSASRDGVLSLWDIDRFERVLSKVNHPGAEVLSVATSEDAGMVFTGGSDRAIRRITRGDDQMFIEDEMEKAMELEVEGEAQRDDLVGQEAATKSSIESVRMLDKIVQMIEVDESDLEADAVLAKKKELVKFLATEMPAGDLQQVVITLPTGHARRLLAVIAEVLETVMNEKRAFPLGFPVEQLVSAGLFLIQAQAKFLVGEPHSRAVLLKLKDLFHLAVRDQIKHVGTAAASLRFL